MPLWQAAIVGGFMWGVIMGALCYVITGRTSAFAIAMVGGALWGVSVATWSGVRKRRRVSKSP